MKFKYNRNYEFDYQFNNRFANNFRFFEQQNSYNNNCFIDVSFSQENYDNDLDNVYTFVDNQQSSRQTQYFIIYQYNNFNYQNRVYQNQSNYRQNSSSSSIETNQSYVKNQSSFLQKQLYRFIEFTFFNTYQQSKNVKL